MKGHFYDATISTCNHASTQGNARRSLTSSPSRACSSLSPTFVFTPKHCSDSGTNPLKVERKHFRVRKPGDGLEGMDGSGAIPFFVSRLHPVCIRRRRIDLRLQGTLTSRSTLSQPHLWFPVRYAQGRNGCTHVLPPVNPPSDAAVTLEAGCES